MADGSKGRPTPQLSPNEGNVGRAPTTVTYPNHIGEGKTYPGPTKSRNVRATDLPLEPEQVRQLVGKQDPQKTFVTETQSSISMPMRDEHGRNVQMTGHSVQYRRGKVGFLITPGGEVVGGPDAFMRNNMLPGMQPHKDENGFTNYSIPSSQMTQDASQFSTFSYTPDKPS